MPGGQPGRLSPPNQDQSRASFANLERSGQAQRIASGRTDGVAGEEAAEVDYVQAVVEVFSVGLKVES